MPRGDKSAYTKKQKRQAAHIEKGYRKSGRKESEAARLAWSTVNKESGGGKLSGSGRARKGARIRRRARRRRVVKRRRGGSHGTSLRRR